MYNVVRAEVLSALFVKSFLAIWFGLVVISIIVICGIYIQDYFDRKKAREIIVIEEGEIKVPCNCNACNELRDAIHMPSKTTRTQNPRKALKKKVSISKGKKNKKLG